MKYNSYEPSPALLAFIKCYWTLEEDAQEYPEVQRIVPDGCMEMIFQFGDVFRQKSKDGSSFLQPKSFVFGQITETLEIEPTGVTNIFSIRFQPGGFSPFSSSALKSMENKPVALNELFGESGEQLSEDMFAKKDNPARINCIETFLLNKLEGNEAHDLLAKRSVEIIMQVNGQLSVEQLSEQININRRNLERKFAKKIGLSPKELSRMVRIQSVLRSLIDNNYSNLTDVAYEFNYYDQAHFIKDFKEFTGESPGKYFSNNLKMAALFSE